MFRLLRLIKPYRATIVLVLVLAFVQALANLYLPTLMADIVDFGVIRGDTAYIFQVGGVMLLIAIAGSVCAVVGSFFSAKIAMGFGRIVRERIFTQVEAFSLHEFDTFSTASLFTRTTNDTTQIHQVLIMILNMTVTAPMMVIGGIVLALAQDVTLTWVLVAVMHIVATVFVVIMRRAIPLFRLL